MTIDEAIERNNKVLETFSYRLEETEIKAVKLGNEALKRVKESRTKAYFTTRSLLPGETKSNHKESWK